MKSTLIEIEDLDNIIKIRELVKNYPNDMELGGKVRALIIKSKKTENNNNKSINPIRDEKVYKWMNENENISKNRQDK